MEYNFDSIPRVLESLMIKVDRILNILEDNKQEQEQLPPTIPLKKAAELAGKTPNALRVQISLGNLKCHHVGGRIYLDTEYFQRWLRGEEGDSEDPRNILKKK